jgi:hypothetical protein
MVVLFSCGMIDGILMGCYNKPMGIELFMMLQVTCMLKLVVSFTTRNGVGVLQDQKIRLTFREN